jgi:succinylglutamate desuccinylase
VDRAEAAVWIALAASGVLPAGSRPEVEAGRALLGAGSAGLPRVVEVRHRHAIAAADGFRMDPGFRSFQPVGAGQVVARDRRGPVAVAEAGRLLMPLYQPLGDDGYFLIREVRPFWLALSARLRRLRLARVLHWLPGVRRHPELPETFVVDRRVARWFALEIFHLLGFRRHGPAGAKMVVSRRANDR